MEDLCFLAVVCSSVEILSEELTTSKSKLHICKKKFCKANREVGRENGMGNEVLLLVPISFCVFLLC